MIITHINLIYTLHIFLQKKEKNEQSMKIRGFIKYTINKQNRVNFRIQP